MAHDFNRFLAILRNDPVRDHALDAKPAWVFSQNGQEILWSNVAGLAFLDIKTLDALLRYRGETSSPITRRLADLATSRQVQQGGLERLRFFVGVRSKSAACLCQIISLPDGGHGVFAIAIDGSPTRGVAEPGPGQIALLEKAGIPAAFLDAEDEIVVSTTAFQGGPENDAGKKPFAGRIDDPRMISIKPDDENGMLIIWDEAGISDPSDGEDGSQPTAEASPADEPDQHAGEQDDEPAPQADAQASAGHDSGPDLDPAIASVFAAAGAALAARNQDTQDCVATEPSPEDENPAPPAERLGETLLDEADETTGNRADGTTSAGDPGVQNDNRADDPSPAPVDETGDTETEDDGSGLSYPEQDENVSSGSHADPVSRLSIPLMESVDEDPEALEPSDRTPTQVPEPSATHSIIASEFEFVPRRAPHRFVWEMDENRRFSMLTPDLADAVGPNSANLVGKSWQDVSSALGIHNPAIASKIAAGETWTGMRIDWPVEASDQMAPVELTALPIYDKNRKFAGYRGFGVCRTDEAKPDPQVRGMQIGKVKKTSPGATPMPVATDDGDDAPVFNSGDILDLFVENPAPADERARFSNMADNVERPDIDPDGNDLGLADTGTTGIDERASAEQPAVDAIGTEPSASGPQEAKNDVSSGAKVTELPRNASNSGRGSAASSNVVPMIPTSNPDVDAKLQRLSRPEREAFQQIAQALGARLEGEEEVSEEIPDVPGGPTIEVVEPDAPVVSLPSAFAIGRRDIPEGILLDRLPTGVLLCRGADVLFANRAALDLLGYQSSGDLRHAGGLEAIFADEGTDPAAYASQSGDRPANHDLGHDYRQSAASSPAEKPTRPEDTDRPITIRTKSGSTKALFARLYSVPWANDRALMIVFEPNPRGEMTANSTAQVVNLHGGADRIEELESILDTATDGVLVMEADGTIQAANRSAEALFAADRADMIGSSLTDYLAPESYRSALDYIDGLARNGVESVLNDGREVIGMESSGGLIPMFMTIGRINKSDRSAKFCAVLRDITQWKKAEEELTAARRQAETASSQKSDFLAKISHEIRTPLNAIIGFSEVMLGERLGPIGTERYKEYLNDIRGSGDYIMSLINDLLDLSKIEAGKMDLTFEAVSVNDILHNCVSLLQPEANRERIIIRTSLSEAVPNVVADARSFQQIVLNLLSNAIKFNKRGGQVIVSSVYAEDGSVCVRVRDTGIGMTDEGLTLALEPFRQLQTTRSSAGGTGLGLPLTKALVEANRARFSIDSKPQQGTMVEIVFPSPRVLAE